jgi:uncharacterized protein (TIGR02599 family)
MNKPATSNPIPARPPHAPAFSLVELLVSMAVLTILIASLASLLSTTLSSWRSAEARFSQFRESQAAFESMVGRLQATILHPYLDYEYPGGDKTKTPLRYVRQSDLHFVCGPADGGMEGAPLLPAPPTTPSHAAFFHVPYGLHHTPGWHGLGNLVNSWGYFIEFSDAAQAHPDFLDSEAGLAPTRRFRLWELQVPAEQVSTFTPALAAATSPDVAYDWFQSHLAAGLARPLAEDVVALVFTPLRPHPSGGTSHDIAPLYTYDTRAHQYLGLPADRAARSRHRLPPLLRITLVALDPASASRLAESSPDATPDLGLDGLFIDANSYDDDLAALADSLQQRNLNYRVFSTTVRLRNSRWGISD